MRDLYGTGAYNVGVELRVYQKPGLLVRLAYQTAPVHVGAMDVDVPLDSFHSDGTTTLIDPVAGIGLWREARRVRDAQAVLARERSQVDKVLKAVLGDGVSLVTTDGVGLALITLSTRRSLDRAALMRALGVPNLSGFEMAHEVRALDIAASIPMDYQP